MATASDVIERTSEPPHLRVGTRLRELALHREILANLIRKELKVKYVASVLGAIWSLLNPAVYLAVFTLVFRVFLDNRVPGYAVFLLSGLLAWNLFSVSVTSATRSVVDNANLVKKVYFPREVLPVAGIGVALVDFLLQSLVLVGFMVATGWRFHPEALPLYPLAFVALLLFTTAVALVLAAANVRYRDVQHLLALALLVWFWMTPIVYPAALVQASAHELLGVRLFHLYLLNPLVLVISGFQRALYGAVRPPGAGGPVLLDVSVGWLAGGLALVAVASAGLLYLTWRLFFRLSGDFAEEL
jgi:ABC-2 type transport system permease protein